MFKAERKFYGEASVGDVLVIYLINTNAKETPNLDDLEIGVNNS